MTRYYVDVDDELAARLKEVDGETIMDTLRALTEEEAPPADEIDHEELSVAERKRRRLRRIRRRGTSIGERPEYDE
ncbi:hypothetical protein NDI85_16560 [Halomicroarcula sp. S1AR25-4]|jgi:hypothetical protein|uniref:hypothetical protein n=1 Tax=Haloarcula sp. S1AR25-4 TaxID=2950538 RepID=UPI002876CEF8|nr:hypothetical protein [Halomicroarcula sp. S1AR25-4]MDS0279409.1 hypothetical protein [Halomicroarcula sp. S1AR25-4]